MRIYPRNHDAPRAAWGRGRIRSYTIKVVTCIWWQVARTSVCWTGAARHIYISTCR